MMRVLVLGAAGQLGRCLQDRCPEDWDLHAPASREADVRDAASIARVVARADPGLVINLAAYNDVDAAEGEPELARAVNAMGAGIVARAAAAAGARLVHISTDYVFDGLQGGRPADEPYREDAATHPLNEYGASKREGELAVLDADPDAVVLRTAWLFSEYGCNFVRTIVDRLQLPLRVVDDQVGTPTYAGDLAHTIIRLCAIGNVPGGIYHFSGAEVLSRYQFACRIAQAAAAVGLLAAGGSATIPGAAAIPGATAAVTTAGVPAIVPVSSRDYARERADRRDGGRSLPAAPARRPPYSALSCGKLRPFGLYPQPLMPGLERVLRREAARVEREADR